MPAAGAAGLRVRELEYRAALAVGAAGGGRAVETAGLVHEKAGERRFSVTAFGGRAKAVKHRLLPSGRDDEHRPVGIGAAALGRAVKISRRIDDKRRLRVFAISAGGDRAEAIENPLLAARRNFEDGTLA